jgi:magnesium chelatase subunit D
MQSVIYPFSAIVNQDAMKTCLLLNAVSPELGGVLIRGHKGTAKTTAVRALGRLLPEITVVADCPYHCPPDKPEQMCTDCLQKWKANEKLLSKKQRMSIIELPLNATEDRVAGSLHIEHALKTGTRRFEPGLIATANQGILYVDEINLLEDHLVDILLDAAASGIHIVEREGISVTHPANFILVGTMNPEEGEIRPQFLDRFGLSVNISSIQDIQKRECIAKRRFEFENNKESFLNKWKKQEEIIGSQVITARNQLNNIQISDDMVNLAVKLALKSATQGHRAEITLLKAARAFAAFLEKQYVERSDLIHVAPFVLRHRMHKSPLDPEEKIDQQLEDVINQVVSQESTQTPAIDPEQRSDDPDETLIQVPGAAAAGSILFDFIKKKDKEVIEPDKHIETQHIQLFKINKNNRKTVLNTRGPYVRSVSYQSAGCSDMAIAATLRKIAQNSRKTDSSKRINFSKSDLQFKLRKKSVPALVVFIVDSSDSMNTEKRIKAAKAAALSLLSRCDQKPLYVALVTFGGEKAMIPLQPTQSLSLAKEHLRELPTGGPTPFSDGLIKAWKIVRNERKKDKDFHPIFIILSDGQANVPLEPRYPVRFELEKIAKRIVQDKIDSIIIDTHGFLPSNEMQLLATWLGGQYYHLNNVGATNLVEVLGDH